MMNSQVSEKRKVEHSPTFYQFECVKTLVGKPEAKIKKGAVGTIVDIYTGNGLPTGYDVSFSNLALETFYGNQLRSIDFGKEKQANKKNS